LPARERLIRSDRWFFASAALCWLIGHYSHHIAISSAVADLASGHACL
jgi:hypothetical protein